MGCRRAFHVLTYAVIAGGQRIANRLYAAALLHGDEGTGRGLVCRFGFQSGCQALPDMLRSRCVERYPVVQGLLRLSVDGCTAGEHGKPHLLHIHPALRRQDAGISVPFLSGDGKVANAET